MDLLVAVLNIDQGSVLNVLYARGPYEYNSSIVMVHYTNTY
jgi:hypothetical protein